ncbi:MAG: transglutaminase family protein [Burkholderiales bacterium]|nr:transglutaminase family protein [Burkholderiales bacterium]MDE2456549.1 transglutaminase family protein [Burkholderiales bacterium]
MTELEVVHETRYAYSAPVSLAQHLACLQPLADGWQRRLDFDLHIEPAPDFSEPGRDAYGNERLAFCILRPHERLLVRAASRLRIAPRFAALDAAAAPPWDELAQRLRYVARAPFEPALEFAQPSPYVPRLAELRDYGRPSFKPGRPLAEAAIELMHRIHADFKYEAASTAVDTPLAQVFEQRRGVCQDFAHLMAGVLRRFGLPARYVSGYLLTRAPEGGAAMLGADASHAWVQAWCPGTPGMPEDGWLDLDPTNDLIPGTGHVRVAVGRDYGDVTPLRGVIRGGGRHTLAVGVTTRLAGPVVASA